VTTGTVWSEQGSYSEPKCVDHNKRGVEKFFYSAAFFCFMQFVGVKGTQGERSGTAKLNSADKYKLEFLK
jgi:hypothetical protein